VGCKSARAGGSRRALDAHGFRASLPCIIAKKGGSTKEQQGSSGSSRERRASLPWHHRTGRRPRRLGAAGAAASAGVALRLADDHLEAPCWITLRRRSCHRSLRPLTRVPHLQSFLEMSSNCDPSRVGDRGNLPFRGCHVPFRSHYGRPTPRFGKLPRTGEHLRRGARNHGIDSPESGDTSFTTVSSN